MAWYEKYAQDFNRADEDPFTDANWTQTSGTKVLSNVLRLNAAGASEVNPIANGITLGNNQYCQVTHTAILSNYQEAGCMLRWADANNWYRWQNRFTSSQLVFYKYVGGVFSAIGSYSYLTNASPAVHRFEITGTALKAIYNGSEYTRTDSSLSSGFAGLEIYQPSPAYTWSSDDFSCGDDQAPAGGIMVPFFYRHLLAGGK